MGHLSIFPSPQWVIFSIAGVLIVGGCSPPPSPVNLSIRVEPAQDPGVYIASGQVNLPDNSQISVLAVRALDSTAPQFDPADPKANFSILERDLVRVEAGQWQTELNLWQVATDGRFREAWQLMPSERKFSPQPATYVTFFALFEPNRQIPALKQQFQAQKPPKTDSLVRLPAEGTWYLQTAQNVEVPLPRGIDPSVPKAEDLNGGWGDRVSEQPKLTDPGVLSSPPTNIPSTNAPLSPSEFMR